MYGRTDLKKQRRILIVDDDPPTATMLARAIARHGYETDAVHDTGEALARASQAPFDAAVLDVVMPGQDGLTLARKLREQTPDLPVVLLTGYANSPLLLDAERLGMLVVQKPAAVQEIVEFLSRSFESS